MNWAQAKEIPIEKIVEHLGGVFDREKNGDRWYKSPFKPTESNASFVVHTFKQPANRVHMANSWHDFSKSGPESHGDGVTLWMDFHNMDRKNSEHKSQALSELSKHFGNGIIASPPLQKQIAPKTNIAEPKPPVYRLLKQPGHIWMDSLKNEITRRGISSNSVDGIFKQVYFENTEKNKSYNGVGIKNNAGGWEISIPTTFLDKNLKASIEPKAPTTLTKPGSDSITVFEGMWDFGSWMELNKKEPIKTDVFILNSNSFMQQFINTIKESGDKYKTIIPYLDNDKSGRDALEYMKGELKETGINVKPMNHLYQGHKDLNDMAMATNPLSEKKNESRGIKI